jgi:ribonucleoside-diphosphate reductase alpha chain
VIYKNFSFRRYFVTNEFPKLRGITPMANNILIKRYYQKDENDWCNVADRSVDHVLRKEKMSDIEGIRLEQTRQMIRHTYFIPNSPCLVNSGNKKGGLAACFTVDFKDSIEEIYKTKLDFALIAKKGGGCGTTLSKLRPENEKVEGSTHGFAGGPIKFFDTICHDMRALTQAGFRDMAMMGTMSIYHPDILKFIKCKETEGVMPTTNISVVVDDAFMKKVLNNETYQTYFDFDDGRKYYSTLNAKDVFSMIVEGAWNNGEPKQ